MQVIVGARLGHAEHALENVAAATLHLDKVRTALPWHAAHRNIFIKSQGSARHGRDVTARVCVHGCMDRASRWPGQVDMYDIDAVLADGAMPPGEPGDEYRFQG